MANHQNSENGGQNKNNSAGLIVVMVPLPAQGHLNQLLHLSRIISSYNIPIHYVSAAIYNRQAKLRIHGWEPQANCNIHFHDVPMPPFDNPPPNPTAPTKYPAQILPAFNASIHLREPIRQLLLKFSSTARRLIVIHDSIMNYVVQDVPSIPNAESYSFCSISAFSMCMFISMTEGKPVLIDGEPVRDLPTTESLYPSEVAEFLEVQEQSKTRTWGSLYNTCRVIEDQYLNLLKEFQGSETEKHWAIGPFNPVLIPRKKNYNKSHECIEWLDKQTPKSVILVSFGSTTSISDEEIEEIALGLERSGQNFIWVLREADRGNVFEGEVRKAQLPEGFQGRVEGRGVIVRDWAPQLEILGHPSTGGFMSHCGWNSCMESISMGVPIAAWPMHSEQPFNAILITKVLKIGVEVRDWALQHQVVKSAAIEKAVKRLVASSEGDEMRQRAAELSKAVKKSAVDGGARAAEMDSFIAHITR